MIFNDTEKKDALTRLEEAARMVFTKEEFTSEYRDSLWVCYDKSKALVNSGNDLLIRDEIMNSIDEEIGFHQFFTTLVAFWNIAGREYQDYDLSLRNQFDDLFSRLTDGFNLLSAIV